MALLPECSLSISRNGEKQSLKNMPPSLHLLAKACLYCLVPGKLKKQKLQKKKNMELNSILSSGKQNVASFVVDFYPAAAKYQSDIKGKLPIN